LRGQTLGSDDGDRRPFRQRARTAAFEQREHLIERDHGGKISRVWADRCIHTRDGEEQAEHGE
jgi:hypothetical protein